MARSLPYPVDDADNHLYESEEAMTAFPGVRVACIENGSRWVRFLFERFELAFGQQPKEFKRHPIETFRRHVWVAPFYEEPIDEVAAWIGVERVLFGSDYPHPEGLATPLSFLDELSGSDPRIGSAS